MPIFQKFWVLCLMDSEIACKFANLLFKCQNLIFEIEFGHLFQRKILSGIKLSLSMNDITFNL